MKVAPIVLSIAVLAAVGFFVFADDDAPRTADVTEPFEHGGRGGVETVANEDANSTEAGAEGSLPGPSSIRERADAKIEPASDLPPPELVVAKVRVRVESELHRPLEGVRLALESGFTDRASVPVPFAEFKAEASTDGEGIVDLAVPTVGVFTVRAEKPGFAAKTIGPLVPGDDVSVMLAPAYRLDGRVVDDETGNEIAGAIVDARGQGEATSTETGADGRFTVDGLPRGVYAIRAVAPGYDRAREDGWIVGNGGSSGLELRLGAGVRVRGRVIARSSGEPIVGATVTVTVNAVDDDVAERFSQEATTNADGRCDFEPTPRSGVEVQVVSDGFAVGRKRLRIEEDEEEHEFVIDLARGGALAGRVVDVDDAPIAGARVSLSGPTGHVIETDAAGSFTFDRVPPEVQHALVAVDSAGALAPASLSNVVLVEGEARDDVVLRLAPGATVQGLVADALGRPVPFAHVRVEDVPSPVWRALGESPLRLTGEDGRFILRSLPESSIRLSARRGEAVAVPVELPLVAGGEHSITLVLDEGAVVAGIVVDSSRAPIDDALLLAFAIDDDFHVPPPTDSPAATVAAGTDDQARRSAREATRRREREMERFIARKSRALSRATSGDEQLNSFRALTRSGPDGRFELTGLDESESLVLLVRAEGFSSRHAFEVKPGDGREVVIELRRLLDLTGRVVDARTRRPIESFRVTAAPRGESNDARDFSDLLARPSARGDSFRSITGEFLLSGLQPLPYEVTARATGFRESKPLLVDFAALGSTSVLIELESVAIVEGRVHGRDGTGIPGVPVFLRPAAVDSGAFETGPKQKKPNVLRRNVDRNGEFRFHGPDPGAYEIGVGDPKAPIAGPAAIHVSEGDRVVQDFSIDGLGEIRVEVKGDDGFLLRGARVRLRGVRSHLNRSLTTGGLGRAEFSDLPSDDYQIMILAKDHQAAKEAVNLQAPDQRDVAVRLTRPPQ